MTIADRLKKVSSRIQQSQLKLDKTATFGEKTTKYDFSNDFNGLKLLAVSKTHPASVVQAGFNAGITEFAESYLQEAENKINQLSDLNIIWHFIGPIQSNKTKTIASLFDWVQSIDRLKVLQRINDQRPANLPPINVCIQINYFNEESKKGAKLSEVGQLLELAHKLPNIALRGLMFIPPRQESFDEQRKQFIELANYYNRIKLQYPNLDTLSMGMSNDLEAAIAARTNMIRIGTDIFGKRK